MRLGSVALATRLLPVLLVSHQRDPNAVVLRPRYRPPDDGYAGAWAGKIGSHQAHHCFGTLGRLPHVQVNVWRVGVKGSGLSYRVPLVSPVKVLFAVTHLLT